MKNINKLFYFFNIKNYIYPIILIYVAKVYIDHNFFNYRITSDTAGTYNYFQYYYNFFLKYKSFPEWIDYNGWRLSFNSTNANRGGLLQYFLLL